MTVITLKNKNYQSTLTAPFDIDLGGMIPIATFAATSTTASVTFSNIPQNYEHLQMRFIAKTTVALSSRNVTVNFNADTSSVYTTHYLSGNGSTVSATADVPATTMYIGWAIGSDIGLNNFFGVNIIDILDYSNTNKFKTTKSLSGQESNNLYTGFISFRSGLWRSTSAITSITLDLEGNYDFAQYSHFALYGIKRAGV